MERSYDVHVRAVRTRKRADRASASYEVRWSVAGQLFSKSFRMKAQADSAAADLRSAAKAGDAFDITTGQPANTNAGATPTVLALAREVFAREWALGAGKTRKSLAEAMAHTAAVLTTAAPGRRGAPGFAVPGAVPGRPVPQRPAPHRWG